ncbi:MAG: Xaa-Pro peptidase family protein [Gordonia sp. (in: high G+C Gram-positive bacteria)]
MTDTVPLWDVFNNVGADVSHNYSRRRTALAAGLALRGVDGVVVSDLDDLRYLTGFTGSNGSVLVWATHAHDGAAPEALICTDGRYRDQVAAQSPDLPSHIARDTLSALVEEAGRRRPGARLGFQSDQVSVAAYDALRNPAMRSGGGSADGRAISVTLVPLTAVVTPLREVKDDGEVALIARACEIGDVALAALIDAGALVPGRTERQVARDLEWAMYSHGAEAIAFETIVAAGPNSAVPHHRPTDDVLAVGDFVKLDFGAVTGGYHSDMTRTVVLGEPADWQREIYDVVAEAQRAGCAALTPGAELAEVDAAARQVIVDAGFGEHYTHGLGHGVGLQIHEAPGIGATATGTLSCGATVTVEPGIYLPGRGGVRIEDTLVVTDAGARSLTATSRTLREL